MTRRWKRPTQRQWIWACLVLSVVAAAAAVPALAGTAGSRQTATLTFTQTHPHRSSGVKIAIDYVNPDDPAAKPPAVRRVATRLRVGSRVDTAVPGLCTASDAELMAQGDSACPADSHVGTGVLTVDTGVAGPGRFITADVVFLNNTNQLIFLSTVRGTSARVVTRARLDGGHVLVSNAPMLPGAPPDGGSIDTVHVRLKAIARTIGGRRRAYVTTPSRCPGDGDWTNRIRFTYSDAVTQVTTNPSPCAA